MRGRTLDNAFVILDEAQNTTHAQMKMFLTRMGPNAKFIITGDPGQLTSLDELYQIERSIAHFEGDQRNWNFTFRRSRCDTP